MFACKNTREEIETAVGNVTKFPSVGDTTSNEENKTSSFSQDETSALRDIADTYLSMKKHKKLIGFVCSAMLSIAVFGVTRWCKSVDDRFKEDVSDDLNEMKVSIDKLDTRVSRLETDVAMIKGDLYGV